MRLHRTLFYFMLAVFVVGVIVACTVEFSTVSSRIATGLISGAMVGLLSSLVNYHYAWQTYISGIYDSTFELFSELEHEMIDARDTVEHIEEGDRQNAILWLTSMARRTEKYDDEKNPSHTRYTKYMAKFNCFQYAPLFPFGKTKDALQRLTIQVGKLGKITTYRVMCRLSFCLEEGHFANEEDEREAIGDRDKFYEYIKQSMVDWRDYTACMMRELCYNIKGLQTSIRPFLLEEDYKELPKMLFGLKNDYLKNLPVRNPLYEKKVKKEDADAETEETNEGQDNPESEKNNQEFDLNEG